MKTTAVNALILLLVGSFALNPLYNSHSGVAYAQESSSQSYASASTPDYYTAKKPKPGVILEQEGHKVDMAIVHGFEALGRGIDKIVVHSAHDIREGAIYVYDETMEGIQDATHHIVEAADVIGKDIKHGVIFVAHKTAEGIRFVVYKAEEFGVALEDGAKFVVHHAEEGIIILGKALGEAADFVVGAIVLGAIYVAVETDKGVRLVARDAKKLLVDAGKVLDKAGEDLEKGAVLFAHVVEKGAIEVARAAEWTGKKVETAAIFTAAVVAGTVIWVSTEIEKGVYRFAKGIEAGVTLVYREAKKGWAVFAHDVEKLAYAIRDGVVFAAILVAGATIWVAKEFAKGIKTVALKAGEVIKDGAVFIKTAARDTLKLAEEAGEAVVDGVVYVAEQTKDGVMFVAHKLEQAGLFVAKVTEDGALWLKKEVVEAGKKVWRIAVIVGKDIATGVKIAAKDLGDAAEFLLDGALYVVTKTAEGLVILTLVAADAVVKAGEGVVWVAKKVGDGVEWYFEVYAAPTPATPPTPGYN